MDIRKLKNPTAKDSSFTYVGREYTVKAGETVDFDGRIVAYYLSCVNGPLVEPEEVTAAPVEEPKVEPKVEEKK